MAEGIGISFGLSYGVDEGGSLKEALYYEKLEDGRVRCLLCPHFCLLGEGKVGLCQGRKNDGGILYAVNYGETTSLAVDPIEKKPLYHFYPGSQILSVAPNGCNLSCPYCQNAEISQGKVSTQYIPPERLVKLAQQYNSVGIAYTYSEPLIWYEYLLDSGKLVHEAGLKNVLVTNGLINEGPLDELLPFVDAMNIDLKSMREDFYRKIVRGDLQTVLKTISMSKKRAHVELTNLVIPTLNDSQEELGELIDWVARLGVDTPLHFSRYFPYHDFTVEPTPVETLKNAWRMAKERLRYVYVGNVWIEGASDTSCYNCGNLLIQRSYYSARTTGIEDGKCSNCGVEAEVVM